MKEYELLLSWEDSRFHSPNSDDGKFKAQNQETRFPGSAARLCPCAGGGVCHITDLAGSLSAALEKAALGPWTGLPLTNQSKVPMALTPVPTAWSPLPSPAVPGFPAARSRGRGGLHTGQSDHFIPASVFPSALS